ncbi:sensor histidine kinase [Kribbella sp. CA-293567]|uniref:sensor histidine kinase n=1 Tax=Kribbella sp. CA-293567 TaxID=3002436 RepID=UPI0022DDE0F4|nr:histidine kinase [Kribbella sp. CA-293567]WBQ07164.1 histidine kinase [Kribbella sp. CA-293567]
MRNRLVMRAGTTLAGVVLGAMLAWVELAFLVISAIGLLPVIAVPRSRPRVVGFVHRWARPLAALEQRRLTGFHQLPDLGPYSDRAAFRYISRRWPIGMLGGFVLLLLLLGLIVAVSMLSAFVLNGHWAFLEDGGRVTVSSLAVVAVPGLVLLYLNVMGIVGVPVLDARLARRYLAPSTEELLARRVSELTLSRAEVVEVVNDERRRIERDLHDGVQQRLVALGLLLSRARRADDPARAAELVRQAHEASEQALDDLREVAWRVYPTVLDQLGLRDVIAVLAERSSIPVTLHYDLSERPPVAVETVAYFVVSEAVTNAAKHSGATELKVSLARSADSPDNHDQNQRTGSGRLVVCVSDNGGGGADPAGRGLAGLAGRVAAGDGLFTVDSPVGGPTIVRAELPCG